ncbi:MAG: type II toxin-antitoxin system RelE family toxin [Acidimicrobiales bacterium]
MSASDWTLRVAASAERSLGRLPEKVTIAVVEFLLGPLCENPRRVGHPLQRELTGLWAARRGPYRVVNEFDDDQQTINVLRIEHRSDVYRPR